MFTSFDNMSISFILRKKEKENRSYLDLPHTCIDGPPNKLRSKNSQNIFIFNISSFRVN